VGQGLLLGNASLLLYAAVVWAAFLGFVLSYEEPKLRKTYGAEYEAYCARVPRWIPRITH
jgi:protein-S-isoprenylcysteine O-methyltransferase Ste14